EEDEYEDGDDGNDEDETPAEDQEDDDDGDTTGEPSDFLDLLRADSPTSKQLEDCLEDAEGEGGMSVRRLCQQIRADLTYIPMRYQREAMMFPKRESSKMFALVLRLGVREGDTSDPDSNFDDDFEEEGDSVLRYVLALRAGLADVAAEIRGVALLD